ncbi:2-keto-4-pentenoate hydratase [Sciscionella sediminilitoris]|uniref:2-keto-4-pentenoate hydratase n=1 Tax=Sciscionella sediminilitoris TaxID=1445613 RepID=UPI0004DF82B1|nr:fumarylacetoacetate hydrolase family protein [Sciscionella sp. SE31]
MSVAAMAGVLDAAARSARAVPRLTEERELDVPQAYAVQRALVDLRLGRGERLAGIKLGFTSAAKMRQMGVSDLIWGWLTDAMRLADGAHLELGNFVHPRIEPEIAFLIGDRIDERTADPVRAIEAVAPAYEIIDSRYEGFRFSLPDVIADNSSSAAFGIGAWRAPDTDLGNLGMLLEIDGRVAETGSSAAILGHPLRSVQAAARLAAAAGLAIEPGWVILAGAATAAVALERGTHARVRTSALGAVEVTVDD